MDTSKFIEGYEAILYDAAIKQDIGNKELAPETYLSVNTIENVFKGSAGWRSVVKVANALEIPIRTLLKGDCNCGKNIKNNCDFNGDGVSGD